MSYELSADDKPMYGPAHTILVLLPFALSHTSSAHAHLSRWARSLMFCLNHPLPLFLCVLHVAAMVQVSLRICAGSPDPSLLAYAMVSKSDELVKRQITLLDLTNLYLLPKFDKYIL